MRKTDSRRLVRSAPVRIHNRSVASILLSREPASEIYKLMVCFRGIYINLGELMLNQWEARQRFHQSFHLVMTIIAPLTTLVEYFPF